VRGGEVEVVFAFTLHDRLARTCVFPLPPLRFMLKTSWALLAHIGSIALRIALGDYADAIYSIPMEKAQGTVNRAMSPKHPNVVRDLNS
jgi:hypothetical protein